MAKDIKDYYVFTNTLSPNYSEKGMGTTTASVGVYLFLKYLDKPEEAVITAANMVGSDTDTIANFVGSLVGCYYGLSVDNSLIELSKQVQDSQYISNLADNLWEIYKGTANKEKSIDISKEKSLEKIKNWKEKLENIMKENSKKEDRLIIHPIFGRGVIESEKIKEIPMKQDYIAKILKVNFEYGQSVYFHSRMKRI